MYAGVFALICAAVAPCLCYMPYLAALPLGGYAIFVGSQAQRSVDASEKAMATAGMLAGGVAAVLSLMVILGVVAYMILVFGVVLMGN